jgi:hypothetical protein
MNQKYLQPLLSKNAAAAIGPLRRVKFIQKELVGHPVPQSVYRFNPFLTIGLNISLKLWIK